MRCSSSMRQWWVLERTVGWRRLGLLQLEFRERGESNWLEQWLRGGARHQMLLSETACTLHASLSFAQGNKGLCTKNIQSITQWNCCKLTSGLHSASNILAILLWRTHAHAHTLTCTYTSICIYYITVYIYIYKYIACICICIHATHIWSPTELLEKKRST